MKFKEYAEEYLNNVYLKKMFAKRLGLAENITTLNNYISERRFPKKEIIEKIYLITKRRVKPEDWFNLEKKEQ